MRFYSIPLLLVVYLLAGWAGKAVLQAQDDAITGRWAGQVVYPCEGADVVIPIEVHIREDGGHLRAVLERRGGSSPFDVEIAHAQPASFTMRQTATGLHNALEGKLKNGRAIGVYRFKGQERGAFSLRRTSGLERRAERVQAHLQQYQRQFLWQALCYLRQATQRAAAFLQLA